MTEISLRLVDAIDSNRRLVVEGGGVAIAVEFSNDDALVSPQAMEQVSAALVGFVRDVVAARTDDGFLCPNWVEPHYRCIRLRGHGGNCTIELTGDES